MSKKGIIYVLLNPCLKEYVKVGKTQRTAEARAKELFRQAKSGLPTEFVVGYEVNVSDYDLVEKLVHERLAKTRSSFDREFFRVSSTQAIHTIRSIIRKLKKQGLLQFTEYPKNSKESLTTWWDNLGFIWQQIFRSHLALDFEPTEIDILRAIHNVIDYSQPKHDTLRIKVVARIMKRDFTKGILKWYQTELDKEQEHFHSYLPYTPTEKQINTLFELTALDCSGNLSIIDLRPVEKLINLQSLNFSNTSVSDLNPLYHLKNLETITCIHNNLTEKELMNLQTQLPNCKIETQSFLSSDIPPTKKRK